MSPPPVLYAGSSPVPIAPDVLGHILASAERLADLDALVERQEAGGQQAVVLQGAADRQEACGEFAGGLSVAAAFGPTRSVAW